MKKKIKAFERRKYRVRIKIRSCSQRLRLSVFKSGRHIYAQIIDDLNFCTLVSASSLDESIRVKNKSHSNISSATQVGKLLADKAEQVGIKEVVFDKGGRTYHGAIRSLAEEVRKKINF